jgi:hypothetical protein
LGYILCWFYSLINCPFWRGSSHSIFFLLFVFGSKVFLQLLKFLELVYLTLQCWRRVISILLEHFK